MKKQWCFWLVILGCALPLRSLAQQELQEQLIAAVKQADAKAVKEAVKQGADVNSTVARQTPEFSFYLSRDRYLNGLASENEAAEVYIGAIHANAVQADAELISTLLKLGANLNAGDSQGKTALMYAVYEPEREAYAQELVQQGAKYTERDQNGNTVLHYAAYGGHTAGIRLALTAGTDLNRGNHDGITPLMAAAIAAPVDVLQSLLDLGADLQAEDKTGMNALHYAAGYGRRDKIKWFLQQDASLMTQDEQGRSPLDLARLAGNNEAVVHFRRKGYTFNGLFYKEMREAVQKNHLESAEQYLFKGANPNRTAETYPLHLAADRGYADMIRLLRRYGAQTDVRDLQRRTPLDLAMEKGHAEAVAALLEGGERASAAQLILAMNKLAMDGDQTTWLPVIEHLAEQMDDFSGTGGKMNIPVLHHAAYLGLEPVVEVLLRVGADPNANDADGWNPLHWAVMKGDLKSSHPEKIAIFEALLAAGASLTAQAKIPKVLPHKQPYLARRVPAHATPMDILDYALPKDLGMEAMVVTKGGERKLNGDDYRSNGIELFLTKDYRTAMLEFNRALGKDPDNAEAYYYRGLCKSALSLYREAERDHEAALTLRPVFPEAIFARGKALFEVADYALAIRYFNESIRMNHEVARSLFLRGKSKLRSGQRTAACGDFTEAIAAGSLDAATAKDLYCK